MPGGMLRSASRTMATHTTAHPNARIITARFTRTQFVWVSLLASLTAVGGFLLLVEGGTVLPAASMPMVELAPNAARGAGLAQVFDTRKAIQAGTWRGIVIHHSGAAMGSARSIAQEHAQRGNEGLGYHFVIGNGQGTADGEIQIGPRWLDQQPGVHVSGVNADLYNRRTIGICLIGDGDRRSFTPHQLASLTRLIAALQSRLGIDDSAILLGREVSGTAGPGRLFPEAAFREQLASLH